MTCKKTERDEYEISVAEYLRPALANHERLGVKITHTQIGEETIEWLNIAVGSVGAPFDSTSGRLIESKVMDEDSTLEIYEMPDGVNAIVFHHPPQRPPFNVPYFSVELYDWPIERSVEEDLGPRFRKALQLLLEACLEARDAAEERWSALHEGAGASERRRKDEKREAETGEEMPGAEENPARNQSPRKEAHDA